ncbi:MAG: glycosyltransferase family 39 protein, partial [Acidobacteria bacterium]|nr:glycosyltransferase family 39 protein [Acidobacteriota bacterium]
IDPDEGRNAEVAREMLATGDWTTPHFNSLTYLDKPVVYFWLVAASFRLCGVTEWAARFPSAVMALATMLLCWFMARRMFGDSCALRAGLVFATSPLVIGLSRFVIFDMTLALLITLAMMCFWLVSESVFLRPVLHVFLFAVLGVAAITKGPVGFLLPLISILVFQGLRAKFGELKRLRWVLGIAVFLVVALPWFVAVSIQHPEFPRYALWQESLQRFAAGTARRGGSVFYYLPVYLAGFFPWSFFLLLAGANRIRRVKELRQDANKPILFLLTWAAVVFVFFTISRSKLPAYFLPAMVPLSILMAHAWAQVAASGEGRRPDWLTAGLAGVIGLGLTLVIAPQAFRFPAVEARVMEKLAPALAALLKPTILYSGLILVALGIVGRNLTSRLRGNALALSTFALVALVTPALVVRWWAPLRVYAASSSSRQLAETIRASPQRDLPVYAFYCFRTGLGFYLRRPVGLITNDGGEMTSNYVSSRLRELGLRSLESNSRANAELGEAAGRLLIHGADLGERARQSSQPWIIIVRHRDVGRLAQSVDQMEPLWNDWQYSIWRIPPGISPVPSN